MNILLTNDDGYDAPGILALFEALKPNHDVTLIAPDQEKSAVGHGITLNEPLRIQPVQITSKDKVYAISGTPADCIKLGLFEICDTTPDLVLSGINPGSNTGVNINYSGTVGAAREAAFNGITSLAVSIYRSKKRLDFNGIAKIAVKVAERIPDYQLPAGTFLNMNAPSIPVDQIKGIRITRQASDNISRNFDKRADPKQRPYFWYSHMDGFSSEEGTDVTALTDHYISITPIQCDMTDYETAGKLNDLHLP